MAQIFTGTSGFSYPAWKPDFYPAKLPSKRFLEHYATRLNSVEVNYTFRQLPSGKTLDSWLADTPEGFAFACKAHMRLTHIMKLKEAEGFTEVFLKALEPLRASRRLGPILFQFAPSFKVDVPRLEAYLPLLPRDYRFAFEFRHVSWLTEEVYETLARRNIALCLAESEKLEAPKVFTADFGYFRLRKADYSDEARGGIAEQVRGLMEAGRDVYVYFKHEDDPHGALWGEELLRSVRG